MSILDIRRGYQNGGLDSGFYQYTPNYSGLQKAYLEYLGNQSKGNLNSIYKTIFKEPEDFYTSIDEKGNEIKIPVDPYIYRLAGFDPDTGQRSTTGITVPVTKAEYFNKEVLEPNLLGLLYNQADPETYLGFRQGISDLIGSDFSENELKYENLYPGYLPRTLKSELEIALSRADSAQLNLLKKNNPKLYDQLMTGVDPDYARYTPFTTRRTEDIFGGVLGKDQSIHDYLDKEGKLYGLSTDQLFSYSPTSTQQSTTEVPTIDPFSGQQVSAQDQAAFTQLQDIFPQQELPTVKPEAPFQPYQSGPSNVGIFAGPSYDKYSAARTDAYANSPSKFDYDIAANQAAGQFVQDRAEEIYGKGIGTLIGTLGAVAGVPLALLSSPGHEAAQVIMEGRMKPGSGLEGFYKAFMNELPFSTARNRALGVMKSIPVVGEPIYQGLTNLTSRDPVLSSLTKNFNNLTLQEMNQIRNTPTEKLIEQARSAGQNGGMGYLLGF